MAALFDRGGSQSDRATSPTVHAAREVAHANVRGLRARAARWMISVFAVAVLFACGSADPAPPPQPVQAAPAVLVTVTASSEPSGAVVTGGGRMLGSTPLVAQVPIPQGSGAGATFEFTFQLPGYQPATVMATPTNNTISIDAALVPLRAPSAAAPEPGPAPPSAVAADQAVPAPSPRLLVEMVRDYQPTDASTRFVWVRTNDVDNVAQLLCDERAVEAARRASQRFGRDGDCEDLECWPSEMEGNGVQRLYAERTPEGLRLIGYWNGMAGDPSRERIQGWRRDLECSEVEHF